MSAELDELYFIWLYEQVGSLKVTNPARTHWKLTRQLYTKEFAWSVPHDDNRVTDGTDLRWEFLEDHGIADLDHLWLDLGCSMLEMLIALSRRMSFQTDEPAFGWFWELVENMGIGSHASCDQYYDDILARDVEEASNRVINRTYAADGQGGLFPLPGTTIDQRKTEIWYQMNEYLMSDI